MFSPSIIGTTSSKIFNVKSLFIIASIGIHAFVLGVGLPIFPKAWQKEKATNAREVGLVELNAAEQSRLPNLEQPSLEDIPQYPDPSSLNGSFFDSSSLPSLPSLPPSYPSASNLPSLPPPPNTIALGNNLPVVVPPQQSIPALPSPQRALPSPSTLPTLPSQPPNFQYPPTYPPKIQPPPINELRTQRPDFGELRPPIPADELINRRDSIVTGSGTPTGNPAGTSQQAMVNGNGGQTNAAANARAALQERRIKQLVAENIRGAESLIADKENTTDEEARENEVNWRVRVKVAQPTEIALEGTYPKAACMRKLEGTTVYGVMVNAQGRVASSPYRPYLIRSAGYPVLNQQALNEIKERSFTNQTGQTQPYRVVVNYKYDPKVCPSLAVAPPESSENKPIGEPSATQKPTPPATPGKAPEETGATTTPAPEPARLTPETPPTRNTWQQMPQETEATTTPAPKPNPAETTAPTRNTWRQVPQESEATTTSTQSKPQQESLSPALTAPRQTPEANETETSTKPRWEPAPASASFRKNPESRPLGTVAPRKLQEDSNNSRETSSDEQKQSTEDND
ncbi:MAG: TonB family protein [Hydrococcus sp. C42_A2020_068]|nr:TonB family protein [Hydrococcus sp. C42_A2020_068]